MTMTWIDGSLTKNQIFAELKKGNKIRHHTFFIGKFIYMKKNKLYDENDNVINETLFWMAHSSFIFLNGWNVVQELPINISEEHIHIPLKNNLGHITWNSKTPPCKEIMEIFEKLADLALKMEEKNKDICQK